VTPPLATDRRGLRAVLTVACFVIVVAGLKAAAPLLLPVLVALFLSLLALPPMRRLQAYGMPSWAAITVVMVVGTLTVIGVSVIVGGSLTRFQDEMPFYRERINDMVLDAMRWLEGRGVDVPAGQVSELLDTGRIMAVVTSVAVALLDALSNLVLVLLTMVFLLIEAQGLSSKLRLALNDPAADLSDFSRVASNVQRYLATKAWVSLLTGVLAGLLVWAAGLDFVWLWALIAFLFNFIPNIGSIIAAIPPVLLALIQYDPARGIAVAAGYLVINLAIGNGLEPRLMGRRLGLSTLVVWMSMLFWGWVWGPVGMLLSVPLTVILKIALEHSDDFRWMAILLGPRGDRLPGPPLKDPPMEQPPPAAG
jgi:AI-2 transport protein TqsA